MSGWVAVFCVARSVEALGVVFCGTRSSYFLYSIPVKQDLPNLSALALHEQYLIDWMKNRLHYPFCSVSFNDLPFVFL